MRVAASGRLNTKNLTTIVSVGILVGTEVIGLALAAGWGLAGIFQLGTAYEYAFMAIFTVLGMYALYRFMQRAVKVEPIRG
ncbi:hypothetical protein GCM10007036_41120 [Alsobacter metallidurans]|uniref:Uncharacterized protein n=1 Tax=Alsobacter metallidurans TaxID=340221 RepID=A0A917IBT9_9HYPH|nr:hypothetical protein GCM10007036_41120 [Alsobacter metallidurans]